MKECPACRRCFPDHVNHCPDDGDATTHSIMGEPELDGRYQLERRLGHGGMGVVFQARHKFLKTAHAIKVILPDLVGNDPMLVTRFRQEALAAAAIRHPNIIAVTDFGVARDTMPYLVMEFVKGKSLHDLLANEGALPPGRALEIMSAIGAGLSAAHRQGIVHRDLKPLNIMMQDGLPIAEGLKVLDFGLAKIKSGELLGSFVQAKTSGLMGSPFYMAPEQWSDEEPDARADIYSLGVILFQMLTGDVPFRGNNIPAIMKKHLTAELPTFASLGVFVPPQIEQVVRHALEKEAENRPATVEEFVGELRGAVNVLTNALKSTSLGPVGAQPPASQPSFSSLPSGSLSQGRMTALRVRTSPPQARVFVNHVSVGATDETGELLVPDMMPGIHFVRVLHDGYADWEQQVECNGGECRVDARLFRSETGQQPSLPPLGDPMAGTISSTSLEEIGATPEEHQQSAIAFVAPASQQQALEEEQQRLAQEEAARQEQARLQAEAEAARKAEELARQQQLAAAEAARLRDEAERAARAEAERRAREEASRLAPVMPVAPEPLPEPPVVPNYSAQPMDAASSLNSTGRQRQGVKTNLIEDVGNLTEAGHQTGWPPAEQPRLHSQPQLQSDVPPVIVPDARRKSVLPLVVISLVALLLIGGGIGAFVLLNRRSETAKTEQNQTGQQQQQGEGQQVGPNEKPPTDAIKPDLVSIPGGTFQMGRNGASILEAPAHTATVRPFAMDRTEVTNAEYEVFVRETKRKAPSHWSNNKPLAGQEQWPVTNVSYDDAVAFAAWRSKRDGVTYRLPTEEEWEFAARNGERNNLYPWGDKWETGRAVIEEASPKPVGSLPDGKDQWGVLDLIGNVWEWTSSKASLYAGSDRLIPPEEREMMIYRGGSYATKMRETPATGTVRNWQKPSTTHPTLGFRLVRSGS